MNYFDHSYGAACENCGGNGTCYECMRPEIARLRAANEHLTAERDEALAELRALREYMRTGKAPAWVYERHARLRWTLVVMRENRRG